MNRLFKIEASINIHQKGGRTRPIRTGYRPGFNFVENKQTSGSIDLLKREELNPGEGGFVEVSFISEELLGEIKPGIDFKFYEGPNEIGKGKVLEVLGWVEN